ncbi:uncharacterized protein [Malus domestica]|uniref:uncharacterized protein n=1 Tax=Malus domestica TaxID=3750 RepID=UPI00049905D8|nr:uncharacterized protein LOC103453395 [Malus domestica]
MDGEPVYRRKCRHRFCFKEVWTSHEECENVIREVLNYPVVRVPMFQVVHKIKVTRVALLKWQHVVFKRRNKEIKGALNLNLEMPMLTEEVRLQRSPISSLSAVGGKKGFLSLKLDISKAYDIIEWNYLCCILICMRFLPKWIALVMEFVCSVSYSFVINERPRGYLLPSRGIRQGHPISPYLFLRCAEGMSALIAKTEAEGKIQGVSMCPGAPSVNHLLFTDDSLLFCRANVAKCHQISEILTSYGRASSQKVNLEKSESVALAIPLYTMNCYLLPKYYCEDLNRLIASFRWNNIEGRKIIHWLSWEKLCIPKVDSGLRLQNLYAFNLSLLAKQGWRILMDPNSLVSRVLKAKYFPSVTFLEASVKADASYFWKNIYATQNIISLGSSRQVSSGALLKIWEDPWIPLPARFRIFTPKMDTSPL